MMKIAVWGLGDRYRELEGRMKDGQKQWLLVDRDSAKGMSPDELREDMFDFLIIGSKRYEKEIRSELAGKGFASNSLISSEYMLIEKVHFKKYVYLQHWKEAMEQNPAVRVLGNWYEQDGNVEVIISIEKCMGYEAEICCFTWQDKGISVVDLKDGKHYTGGQNVSFPIMSDGTVLKITSYGLEIPHMKLNIKKSEWNILTDKIVDDEIKRIFLTNMSQLATNFSYHEEDYLFLRNFKEVRNGIILDCGANFGQSVISFLKATNYMRIISFEANPLLIEPLRIIEKLNQRVQIMNCGVGSEKGEMTFYYDDEAKGLSGSFDKEDLMRRLRNRPTHKPDVIECTVPVHTIDEIVEDGIVFAKLDIEGYEYEALKGMQRILRHCRPMLLIENNAVNAQRINQFLGEDYQPFYYNYIDNTLVKENVTHSINYWMIPKEGTMNEEVNAVLDKML